jgi:glycosyltransferase involved in cell wall biosynthesis
MRLAIISDDYLPDSTLVHAKMLHELALEFIDMGHFPVVICPSSLNQSSALSIDYIDGVEIWRFKNGKTRGVGKVKRAINETLLSFNAWRAIAPEVTKSPFEGVIYYSPSIFFGSLVKKIKKYCSCPSYLILRDSFPQWAVDEGLKIKGSLIEKYFRFFEKINYNSADYIGLMSPKNLELFNNTYEGNYNNHVLYNWADHQPKKNESEWLNIRNELNLHEKIIFFYGGNIGHAQDIGNLLRLASSMKDIIDAHFLFVGQGDEVNLVKQYIIDGTVNNVSYLTSVSQEKFKHILSQVDVGLFS